MSKISSTMVKGNVKRRSESQYEISYQPAIKGRHQLHIEVEGHHIRGSPFSVIVIAPFEKLDTPLQTIQIKCPAGVMIHKTGEIITTSGI